MRPIETLDAGVAALAELQIAGWAGGPRQVGRLTGLQAAVARPLLEKSHSLRNLIGVDLNHGFQIGQATNAPSFQMRGSEPSYPHENVDRAHVTLIGECGVCCFHHPLFQWPLRFGTHLGTVQSGTRETGYGTRVSGSGKDSGPARSNDRPPWVRVPTGSSSSVSRFPFPDSNALP